MSDTQESGVNTPVLFVTAGETLRAVLNRQQKFWTAPERYNDDSRDEAMRTWIRCTQGMSPMEQLEVLTKLTAIVTQQNLEETLLAELQRK